MREMKVGSESLSKKLILSVSVTLSPHAHYHCQDFFSFFVFLLLLLLLSSAISDPIFTPTAVKLNIMQTSCRDMFKLQDNKTHRPTQTRL